LPDEDLAAIDVRNGGRYEVAMRTAGAAGREVLRRGVESAVAGGHRLLGFFGCESGHLPYQTADGRFDPTRGSKSAERYSPADLQENPTLAEMTAAALDVLEHNPNGFWLMVEAGDVDWANHDDNIDNAIGAVFSGDDAVKVITDWVDSHDAWGETALIITSDHGHLFHLVDPEALAGAPPRDRNQIATVRTEK
jgi:alkaline phosphatase